jgi:hypothetical protein
VVRARITPLYVQLSLESNSGVLADIRETKDPLPGV